MSKEWEKVIVIAGVSRGEAYLSVDCPACGQIVEQFDGDASFSVGSLKEVAKNHMKARHPKAKATGCAGGCSS